MTAHAWPAGGKLGFLGLGFLGLTQSQVPGTEGGSQVDRKLDLIQGTNLKDAPDGC